MNNKGKHIGTGKTNSWDHHQGEIKKLQDLDQVLHCHIVAYIPAFIMHIILFLIPKSAAKISH